MAKKLEEETINLVRENFGDIEYGKNNPSYRRL